MIRRKFAGGAWAMGFLALGFLPSARAEVRMPAIFGDHMVLQREIAVPVWGWADPGEKITLSVDAGAGAGASTASTIAGSDGRWRVNLEKLQSGQTLTLTIAGANTLMFTDVLVGDVWLCAGQSNMAFPLVSASNAAEAMPKANHPQMRLFNMEPRMSFEPQNDCKGKWVVCTPAEARMFSAVGYFYGRDVHEKLGQPIGLINASYGGTAAEAWTSAAGMQANAVTKELWAKFEKNRVALRAATEKYEKETAPEFQRKDAQWRKDVNPAYQAALREWNAASKQAKSEGKPEPAKPQPASPKPMPPSPPNRKMPTLMNNGMIAPIAPFAIKGVVWYQGETNTRVSWAGEYFSIFAALIADWRSTWGQGDFPFLFVQLANQGARAAEPGRSDWALVREAQAKALALPNTGMAVAIDLGEMDVHARNKVDVGNRLALVARRLVYGEQIIASGPSYQSMNVEGQTIRLRFGNVGSGLCIAAGPATDPAAPAPVAQSRLRGFAIAGADRKFVWAEAKIEGETVVVWSEQVAQPVAVRYGWADNPEVNLYNREGLPAAPFRTDTWAK